MGNWICKRCETANGDGAKTCEVCSSPLLYTHEELEQVVVRRVNEIQAALAAAPAPAPALVPATNCDGAWALALTFGLIALGLFVLLIFLLDMATQ